MSREAGRTGARSREGRGEQTMANRTSETAPDLVIRGGAVVDGSGGDPFEADVAVKDGVIAAIGKDLPKGREEIDARNRIVTPGFVDVHTHYDAQVTW
ncbi:MAG: amidohydrolase family protein, partial [Alphaproteobacteria bacterium]